MAQWERDHKDRLSKHIAEKKEIFKNYISKQSENREFE